MIVKHVVEKEDGSVVFQGILSGAELSFILELGLDCAINNGIAPFVSTNTVSQHDIYSSPEQEQ